MSTNSRNSKTHAKHKCKNMPKINAKRYILQITRKMQKQRINAHTGIQHMRKIMQAHLQKCKENAKNCITKHDKDVKTSQRNVKQCQNINAQTCQNEMQRNTKQCKHKLA